ncbi:MAG: periplasmic heavy metal sensor, partial [bacterium]|nr:periplasmic heavy metal sensor [bacterium]
MKNNLKWVKIVLAASLALNLAFAASYVYNKFLHKSTWKKEKKIQLEEGLNLDKEQKKKIDAVIRTFKLNMWDYKQDILEKRIAIIDELGDPEFDPDTITTRTNELNKLENDLNLLFV